MKKYETFNETVTKRQLALIEYAQHANCFAALDEDALADRRVTAAGMGLSRDWLEQKAWLGGGPPFVKVGGRCLYRKRDVLAWLSQHGREMRSTSDTSKR